MKEEWRDIPGYETHYSVSNKGEVKSKTRKIWNGQGEMTLKGRLLKQLKGSRCGRYRYVALSKNGIVKRRGVHQLVAAAFLSHDVSSLMVVDHIDNDPSNNKLNNLQILSHRDNLTKDPRGSCDSVGVSFSSEKNKFCARCQVDGKRKYLGSFDTEKEASIAYQNFLKEHNER